MKVLKFGGTSVGSVESIQNVKRIVEGEREQVIVVVSALGGITDQLIRTSSQAVSDGRCIASFKRLDDEFSVIRIIIGRNTFNCRFFNFDH